MAYADKKAAFQYVNEYQKEKYDRITILRPAGQKAKIKEIAELKKMSVNEFINNCIDKELKKSKIEL